MNLWVEMPNVALDVVDYREGYDIRGRYDEQARLVSAKASVPLGQVAYEYNVDGFLSISALKNRVVSEFEILSNRDFLKKKGQIPKIESAPLRSLQFPKGSTTKTISVDLPTTARFDASGKQLYITIGKEQAGSWITLAQAATWAMLDGNGALQALLFNLDEED